MEGFMIYKLKESAELIELDDGQSVIFYAETGDTHVLDSIGNAIILLCNGKNKIDEIVKILSAEYDVASDVIEKDVITFLDKLYKEGVLDSKDIL